MKHPKTILLSLLLVCSLLLPSTVFAADVDGNNADSLTPALKSEEEISLSMDVSLQTYEDAVFMSEAEFLRSRAALDGITVVYGSNLDVDAINERLYGSISVEKEGSAWKNELDSVYDEATGKYLPNDRFSDIPLDNITTVEDDDTDDAVFADEKENVYIAIISRENGRTIKSYVSVIYESDVSEEVIEKFVEADTTEAALDNYLKDELNRRVQISGVPATLLASSSRIVDETVRNASSIANYTVSSNVYPVMVYKYKSVYTSILIENELKDRDRYILHASAYITPGNAISSSEADGIYNNKYKNAIVVCAGKVFFENKYPEMDYYVDMTPKVKSDNITNVSSISLDFSLSAFGLAASIPISFETGGKVASSYKFTMEDQCYYMFEGTSNLYRKCLSTEPFLIASAVSFSSGYNQLYTTFGTHVKYHFGASASNCTWSGRAIDVYYENND